MGLTPIEREAAREYAYEFSKHRDAETRRVGQWLRELLRETEDKAREIHRLQERLMAEALK